MFRSEVLGVASVHRLGDGNLNSILDGSNVKREKRNEFNVINAACVLAQIWRVRDATIATSPLN